MFDIYLTTEVPEDPDDGASVAVYGKIQIGEFRETFFASLSAWSAERYDRQWREAAQRLVDGASESAFVTSFISPNHSDFFVWWACYLSGELVYIQNQMRFYDQLPSDFAVDSLYDFVGDRKTLTADGMPISEWQMPLQWVRDFLRK